MVARIAWPEGKKFAFTVFDDADYDRLTNTRPVYDFLADLGLLTTKSLWTLPAEHEAPLGGLSTADAEYLAWAQSLQRNGFEIGWHNARCHSARREETAHGLDRFREQFGHDPRTMSNHFQNTESVYWGAARLSGAAQLVYRAANFHNPVHAQGHVEGSEFFWGDLCQERIGYVRNFVFRDIDTLAACPWMPYHDAARPFARAWFASAEGGDVRSFCTTISEENQDRLAASGGGCIMYAHFAKNFCAGEKIEPRFAELMRRLAGLSGWFVPVGTLLDYLAQQHGGIHEITTAERRSLEWRWLRTKLRYGSS